MRLFTWSFPQTAPIVVSRILRVSGSSGHGPGSKDLQNKQGTDSDVSVGSPMLKLDREKYRASMSVFQWCIFTYLSVAIPSLFMKEKDDPLFMESG